MHRGTERHLPVTTDPYVETPKVMYHYSLTYEQYKLQVTLYALKIAIYPYSRYDDIMGLVRPLLIDHADKFLSIDDMFMVTTLAVGATEYLSAVCRDYHV